MANTVVTVPASSIKKELYANVWTHLMRWIGGSIAPVIYSTLDLDVATNLNAIPAGDSVEFQFAVPEVATEDAVEIVFVPQYDGIPTSRIVYMGCSNGRLVGTKRVASVFFKNVGTGAETETVEIWGILGINK